jgi:hypothetical protein
LLSTKKRQGANNHANLARSDRESDKLIVAEGVMANKTASDMATAAGGVMGIADEAAKVNGVDAAVTSRRETDAKIGGDANANRVNASIRALVAHHGEIIVKPTKSKSWNRPPLQKPSQKSRSPVPKKNPSTSRRPKVATSVRRSVPL